MGLESWRGFLMLGYLVFFLRLCELVRASFFTAFCVSFLCKGTVHASPESPAVAAVVAAQKENVLPPDEAIFFPWQVKEGKSFVKTFQKRRSTLSAQQYKDERDELKKEVARGEKAAAVQLFMTLLIRFPKEGISEAVFFEDLLTYLSLASALPKKSTSITDFMGQVAYAAFKIAKTPEQKAAALLAYASLGMASDQAYGLVAKYARNMGGIPGIKKAFPVLQDMATLRVSRFSVETRGDTAAARIAFTFPLKVLSPNEIRDLIRVTPEVKGEMYVRENEIVIGGLDFGKTYKCEVADISSIGGDPLDRRYTIDIPIPNRASQLSFVDGTYVLAQDGTQNVSLSSINVDRVKISLFRLSSRGTLGKALNAYDLRRKGECLWSGHMDIVGEQNKSAVTNIPIKKMMPVAKNGSYALLVEPEGLLMGNHSGVMQPFVVTDVGVSATRAEDGLHVWVRSLGKAKPYAGAKIDVISRHNFIIASGVTDKHGYIRFEPNTFRNEGRCPLREDEERKGDLLEGSVIHVSHDQGGFLHMTLDKCALDFMHYKIDGHTVGMPLDCFLYADRGVYRPGEEANISGIVRMGDGNASRDTRMTLKLIRPDGIEDRVITFKTNDVGAFSGKIAIDASSMLGTWRAEVYGDPARPALQKLELPVAEFTPPRLECKVKFDGKEDQPIRLGEGGRMGVTVGGRYLFGAPAQGLDVNALLAVRKRPLPFGDAAKDYVFGEEGKDQTGNKVLLSLGKTDSAGMCRGWVPYPESLPQIKGPLELFGTVSILEAGGRPVRKEVAIPLVPADRRFIGIKPLFKNRVVPLDDNRGRYAGFNVVLVDAFGNPAAGVLSYTLNEEIPDFQWYQPSPNEEWTYKFMPRRVMVSQKTMNVGVDKPAELVLEVPKWGTYVLEITDPKTHEVSTLRFHVGWAPHADEPQCPSAFPVASTASSFKVGEDATIMFHAPFTGRALVQIISRRLVSAREVDVRKGKNSLAFFVRSSWGPGAYAIVTLFRPWEKTDLNPLTPKRAVGITWIPVAQPDDTKIALDVKAPDEVRPLKELSVRVTVGGGSTERYVTAALVDEGILSLTDFKTPDAFDYFYGKKKLTSTFFDMYNRLIEDQKGAAGILKTGAGDVRMAAALANVIAEFRSTQKSMALFSGLVRVDKNGEATLSFAVPEFNGKARLMVSAISEKGVGSAEKLITVRDPVVWSAFIPKFLSIGDKTELSYRVHPSSDVKGGEVTFSAEGVFEKREPVTVALSRKEGESREVGGVFPVSAREQGEAYWVANITPDAGENYKRTAVIPVYDPRLPYREEKMVWLAGGEEKKVSWDAFDGVSEKKVEVHANLACPLPVRTLWEKWDAYPFGCLEQKISKVLPLLEAQKLAAMGIPLTPEAVKSAIARAVIDLTAFQGAGGGFSLWAGGGREDEFITLYAADWLFRVKEKGVAVPEFVVARLKKFWQGLLFSYRSEHMDGEFSQEIGDDVEKHKREETERKAASRKLIARGLYVFARARECGVAEVRRFKQVEGESLSFLSRVYMAAALGNLGDVDEARALLDALLKSKTLTVAGGKKGSDERESPLWEMCEATIVLYELGQNVSVLREPTKTLITLFLQDILALYAESSASINTMEYAALMRVAALWPSKSGKVSLVVDGHALSPNESVFYKGFLKETQAALSLKNVSSDGVWVSASLIGKKGGEKGTARQNGIEITREVFTLDGQAVKDFSGVRQGDVLYVVLSGRCAFERMSDAHLLLVDRLAAGFEIEQNKVGDAEKRAEFLGELTPLVHQETRDHMYVCALTLEPREKTFRCMYTVRAVTVGEFSWPAGWIEDMYRMRFRAETRSGRVRILSGKASDTK